MNLLLLTTVVPLVSGVLASGSKPPASPSEATITASVFLPVEEDTRQWYLQLFAGVRSCKNDSGQLRRIKDCLIEAFLKSLDSVLEEKQVDINPYVTIVKERSGGGKADAREDARSGDLIAAIYKRFYRIMDTHSFQLRFYDPNDNGEEKFEGRRRHRHYRKAFPMMVAGYMMMSAFLIPLGFQFMAMIGGKALLLAKMAFFMSMFSGYKRLTNDIEYHHHGHGHDPFHHHGGGGYFHHRSSEVPSVNFGEQSPMSSFLSLRKGRR